MAFDAMMLGVYKIPEITVNSGTDWVTLFGFLLTAIAVIAGSMVTVWTFRKTVHSQEELAKKVSLKQSRQEWINTLRDCCAKYVATIMVINNHASSKKSREAFTNLIANQDVTAAANFIASWHEELNRLRSTAYEMKYKIELLSNPKEVPFKDLCALVLKAIAESENNDSKSLVVVCDEITRTCQKILKQEWDRARLMT